jgi:uracil-DNA glycosylase
MLNSWHQKISALQLQSILKTAYETSTSTPTYPPINKVFNAFEKCSFANTKVIIIGQDPYHQPNQAHGLSFSVPDGVKIPPSLRNIYKELNRDLKIPISESGNLHHWASQGVLLLNSVLTVHHKTPGSHAKIGWQVITDNVISTLSNEKENLVFLLWGAYAQKKEVLINSTKHLVLKSTHPSPFSAYKGFLGSNHFSSCNSYLKEHSVSQINW